MISGFNNSLEILQQAQKELLYGELVLQLQKDCIRANIGLKLSTEMEPHALKTALHEKIYVLILEKFELYLNLLYVVDIPEQEIKNLASLDAVDASSRVCFLILAREWQKVWFRHKYNS
ncbi:hypothetical protein [Flagellimonas myxillae]|uniref:hypothetical protein n=1 Tax=Flagellimonas myxillae TaxID=2942214 RepID=UPI00201F2CBB|nr:hypothetical protein [Muricauda myxillae]MCL6267240.1 hypothetical protein [Muricauda myxillae]